VERKLRYNIEDLYDKSNTLVKFSFILFKDSSS
jgi:hypothetical protein